MIDNEKFIEQLGKSSQLALDTVTDIIESAGSERIKLEACKLLLNKILPDLQINFNKNEKIENGDQLKLKLMEAVQQLKANSKIIEANVVKEKDAK